MAAQLRRGIPHKQFYHQQLLKQQALDLAKVLVFGVNRHTLLKGDCCYPNVIGGDGCAVVF
jgi:hypothetical protein